MTQTVKVPLKVIFLNRLTPCVYGCCLLTLSSPLFHVPRLKTLQPYLFENSHLPPPLPINLNYKKKQTPVQTKHKSYSLHSYKYSSTLFRSSGFFWPCLPTNILIKISGNLDEFCLSFVFPPYTHNLFFHTSVEVDEEIYKECPVKRDRKVCLGLK